MIEEAKKLLREMSEMSGDDEDKKALVERYAKDLELFETVETLKKIEHYAKIIVELEKANETNRDTVMNANTFKTPPEVIAQVVVEFQAIRRVLNTLNGPVLSDVIGNLEKSIATLKEEKKMTDGE